MMKYLLTIVYIIFTTSGLALMKLGGDSFKVSMSGGPMFKMGWLTFFGFVCYLISFLLWQRLLVKYDLSYIVPIATGIVQVIVLLMGYLIFKEKVSVFGVVGAVFVIIGIVLMAFGKR